MYHNMESSRAWVGLADVVYSNILATIACYFGVIYDVFLFLINTMLSRGGVGRISTIFIFAI